MKDMRMNCKMRKRPYEGTQIAAQLGITPQMLYHYESGKRKIQFDLWWRWCEALGVTHRTAVEKIQSYIKKDKRAKYAEDQTRRIG